MYSNLQWALSNLARGSTPSAAFAASGVISRMLALLARAIAASSASLGRNTTGDITSVNLSANNSQWSELIHEICWILVFVSAKEEGDVTLMIQEGLVRALCEASLLFPAGSPMAIPMVRTLGNITSGPLGWLDMMLIEPLYVAPVVQMLHRQLSSDEAGHRSVIKESLWVVANILGVCM